MQIFPFPLSLGTLNLNSYCTLKCCITNASDKEEPRHFLIYHFTTGCGVSTHVRVINTYVQFYVHHLIHIIQCDMHNCLSLALGRIRYALWAHLFISQTYTDQRMTKPNHTILLVEYGGVVLCYS